MNLYKLFLEKYFFSIENPIFFLIWTWGVLFGNYD
jgi:hypothetical protein